MSAPITILNDQKGESIQMSVEPDERLENILERCMKYWLIEGDKDRFVFLRRNDQIDINETVISAGIERGDVLKLVDKSSRRESETEEDPEEMKEDAVNLAERWLESNIGIDPHELEYVKEERDAESANMIFQLRGKDGRLTVQVKNGKVSNYIPRDVTSEEGE